MYRDNLSTPFTDRGRGREHSRHRAGLTQSQPRPANINEPARDFAPSVSGVVGGQIPRGPRAMMNSGGQHGAAGSLQAQPQCLSCTQLGHDYTQCTYRCAHCPERAYHNGQRCRIGEALGIYPVLAATIEMKLDVFRTLSDVLMEWTACVAEKRIRLKVLQGFENKADQSAGRDQPSSLQMAGTTPAFRGTGELETANTCGPTVQTEATTTAVDDLPGWVPAVMPRNLNKNQRKTWKRQERQRKKDYADTLRSSLSQQDQSTIGVTCEKIADARVHVAAETMGDAIVKTERSDMGGLPTDISGTRIIGGQALQPVAKIDGVE